jgi:hypothetical protein
MPREGCGCAAITFGFCTVLTLVEQGGVCPEWHNALRSVPHKSSGSSHSSWLMQQRLGAGLAYAATARGWGWEEEMFVGLQDCLVVL